MIDKLDDRDWDNIPDEPRLDRSRTVQRTIKVHTCYLCKEEIPIGSTAWKSFTVMGKGEKPISLYWHKGCEERIPES